MRPPVELVILLVAAFAFGFAAQAVGLPPLVGYLVAGFGLHAFGIDTPAGLDTVSDIGILLLLFGIGLKLDLRTLARPVVAATTTVQLAVTIGIAAAVLLGLGAIGVPLLGDLDARGALTIGFALSFSSTVFAIKALEENNESQSLGGRLAVGILILQDVFAVAFLAIAGGAWPSPWLLAVVAALLLLRPALAWMLDAVGRGEVLTLLGFALAIGVGLGAFGIVGAKPDIGALVAGLLLAGHPRARELSERLLGFKDLFLVGFFLSIGLGGTPSGSEWAIGLALLLLIPLRSVAAFWSLTRFRLRARTSLHSTLALSTYSEFGLIVTAGAVSAGYLTDEWVGIIGVAVAASFILAAPVHAGRHEIYARLSGVLGRWQRSPLTEEDGIIDVGSAEILVFGMGRVGTGAFDELLKRCTEIVVGVDRSQETVDAHRLEGRFVIRGDALDRDFWERARFHPDLLLVIAAMSSHSANLECTARVREYLPWVNVASIATYPDEVRELREAGVAVPRNLYEEAGQGLADDALRFMGTLPPDD
jgi:predicted Kef-type K+ transport protein